MSKLFKKGLFIIGFILIYFLGIREARSFIHDLHLGKIVPEEYGIINEEIGFMAQSSVSFTFSPIGEENAHGWQYKMPFGSFFLFAALGLIIIGATGREYGILSLIHLVGGILSFIFVLLGLHSWSSFFIVPDLLSRYLIPVSSLGFVALVYLQHKSKSSHEE